MDLIGSMYHTVAVLTNAGGTLGAGAQDNYSTLLTTRCELKNGGGSRGNVLGIIEGQNDYRIVTRYQSALWSAVSMSMKFVIEGVTYTMQKWERVGDKRKEYIQFNVSRSA